MLQGSIVVGLGGDASPDHVVGLCRTGAREFYVGYVPVAWSDNYGYATSPNRRAWRGASYTTPASLAGVIAAAHRYGAKVSLALNELLFSRRAACIGSDLLDQTVALGVDAVIVSDLDLLQQIRSRHPGLPIHASSEIGVYNSSAVRQLAAWGVSRIIFPRHTTCSELRSLCSAATSCGIETEAFVMSERCRFEGGYCFSDHGYLSKHLCNDLCRTKCTLVRLPGDGPQDKWCDGVEHLSQYERWHSHCMPPHPWIGGECGLCAIPQLIEAGIRFFKIVGRGSDASTLEKRTRATHRAMAFTNGDYRSLCRDLVGDPAVCDARYRCYYRE